MTYLICKDLAVGYAGAPVAEGITFSVDAGDAVFVVGENGAGKSTLLKTLLGLVPAVSGEFSLNGGVSAGGVGYLPQKGESQRDFPASAWEVALSGRACCLGMRPFYSRGDKAAVDEAMQRVGADSLRDMPFGALSGGQQQRVLLARALAAGHKLLVLDEPTTGLDPEASESLYRTIDDLRADGAGVLAVTHDVGAAITHATRFLEMASGKAELVEPEKWAREKGGAA